MNKTQSADPFFNPADNNSIDIKRYLSLFISNWYWFAIALFISLSIAYGINRWSEEIYTVSSTLLIKDDQFGGTNSGLTDIFPGTEGFRSQQNLQNEIGILKSFYLNYKVMQELPEFHVDYTAVGKRGFAEMRVYKKSPFVVIYDSLEKQSFGEKIEIKITSEDNYKIEINGDINFSDTLAFGERFNEPGYDFIINRRDSAGFTFDPGVSNSYYFYFIRPATLANRYRKGLTVTPIEEEASLVTLTISGSVPEQAADYLNKLMEVYRDFGLDFKNKTGAQTIEFIEMQLTTISDSLRFAEDRLESFKFNNKLIDISREGIITQGKLEKIDADMTALLLQKKYYEYLKDYIESRKENADIIAPSVMGVTDQLLIKLVAELSQYQQQKRQLNVNISDTEEPLKLVETNISNTRLAISGNITDGLRNIESEIAHADRRLEDVEKEIQKLPSTERQMVSIQRQFDINNTVYTFLLEKRAEAGIAKASNVPDNRIIDNAGPYNSELIKPKERKNYIKAITLGFFFPLLIIILIDFLNNKIIDKRDIEIGTSAPVIGYISHNSRKTEVPVVESPGSTLAESFRSVRTNLKYFIRDVQNPVISVTSTISSEGKTFVSSNLAVIVASLGKKVLLVGLDLRKPRLHKIFGIDNSTGISTFLIGQEKFENILIQTEVENLWYAPSGPVPPNPAELIESKAMGDFLIKARGQFDYIIIDTPPIAIVTDALLLSPLIDFYIFVVKQRYSSKNTLELIEELHKNENIKSIGIVLNDLSLSGYYGYGLRYGYSIGYGYSYGYNYYGNYANSRYGYSGSSTGYYKED